MHRFLSPVFGPAAVAAVVSLTSIASAAPVVITGSGSSNGINSGFGDRNGIGSTLSISSNATMVNWSLDSAGASTIDNANAVVVYIDTDNGGAGFNSTATLTDTGANNGDELRKATSGFNGTSRSTLTFAPGFNADYAIAFQSGFGVLFELAQPEHVYKATVTGPGFGANGVYNFTTAFADLGIAPGSSIRYVATYLDPNGAFRSDEFQGVAASTVPAGNPGNGGVTLAAGDFNTYNSAPEPAGLTLLGLAGAAVLRRRRA